VIRSRFHPSRDAVIALATVVLFAWLIQQALPGGTGELDAGGRRVVHSYAAPWLTVLMRGASTAGSGLVLWPLGALIAALLARAGRVREAALFGVAVVGANLVSESMKLFFRRARPEPWFGYALPSTYSFPSGHAFVSFCFYLCLAEIVIRDEWPLTRKAAIWTAAVACTMIIGLSRVYLGVHYPTDVLAGYVAGIAWTTLIRAAHHMWWGRRVVGTTSRN
jgi:undecaprenyl-diphosphatase